jgi:hypothetical protein
MKVCLRQPNLLAKQREMLPGAKILPLEWMQGTRKRVRKVFGVMQREMGQGGGVGEKAGIKERLWNVFDPTEGRGCRSWLQ